MRTLRRPIAIALNLLLAASLIAVWVAFAPAGLGGQASYVMINGSSMEPNFHNGDLVIVRQVSQYQVGDIITYHDAVLGAYIIHRVVEVEGGHFITKGDNNTWLDEYQPTASEIIGKYWIYLPKVGSAVLWIRTPFHLALMIGLLGGLLMFDMISQNPNKNGRKKKGNASGLAGTFEVLVYTAGFLTLAFAVVSILAFSRSTLRTADDIQYKQTGAFSYTAAGNTGVYDTGSVQSGDPVFTKLTCSLNLNFSYTLQAAQMGAIAATQQFYAVVGDDQSGWQRTLPLTEAKSFNGSVFGNSTTLDLCQVEAMVNSMESETGFKLNSSYSLKVVSHVIAGGTIADQPFSEDFEPSLTFKFDSLHFYIDEDPTLPNPMQTSAVGNIANSTQVANTIKFLGLNLPVISMRFIGVAGFLVGLGGLLALMMYYQAVSKRNQDALIQIKYGSLLMNVYDRGLENLAPVIDVTSIDDLAKLAMRENVMIMHLHLERRDFVHYYLVQIHGTTYRFVTGKGKETEPGKAG